MKTLVVACVLMLVYAESTSVTDKTGSGKIECNQSISGVTGPELRDCVQKCGHKPYDQMNDNEACDSLTCAGYAFDAINNENEIDIVKIIQMCNTSVTPPTNQTKCLINTIYCYKEIVCLQEDTQSKIQKFFQCVVELKTMDYVDKE
ncbi:uncharacterized protein LOC114944333 [Nylanderia fulva]|uniref:uncharacterized protein LOC114944333 n=1 Tax=Nylanderia fulva TaxID=613905 RepID=UPI0010FAFC34|nr:uncharacterized protein LOC114944333 [Nylanderia fulva]